MLFSWIEGLFLGSEKRARARDASERIERAEAEQVARDAEEEKLRRELVTMTALAEAETRRLGREFRGHSLRTASIPDLDEAG